MPLKRVTFTFLLILLVVLVSCSRPSSDHTVRAEKEAPNAKQGSLSGVYSLQSGEATSGVLNVTQISPTQLVISLGVSSDGGAGNIPQEIVPLQGDTAIFRGTDGCTITIKFSGVSAQVEESDCNDYHGASVGFDGTYVNKDAPPPASDQSQNQTDQLTRYEGCWKVGSPPAGDGEASANIYLRLAPNGVAQVKTELLGAAGRPLALMGKSPITRESGTWSMPNGSEIDLSGVLDIGNGVYPRIEVLGVTGDSMECLFHQHGTERLTLTRITQQAFDSDTLSVPLGAPTIDDYDMAMTVETADILSAAQKGDRAATELKLKKLDEIAAQCIHDFGYPSYLPLKEKIPPEIQQSMP